MINGACRIALKGSCRLSIKEFERDGTRNTQDEAGWFPIDGVMAKFTAILARKLPRGRQTQTTTAARGTATVEGIECVFA